MLLPQTAIFAQGTNAHYFLEFDIRPGVSPPDAVAGLARLQAPEVAAGGVNFVIGFGSDLWRSLARDRVPPNLTKFAPIEGPDGHRVPATPHDLWVWISGSTPDVTWDHARAAQHLVRDVAALATEQAGFTYRDSRDVTGFIDGTANPTASDAPDVALVPTGEPGEGGSHVLVIRWLHDLDAFHALSVQEQEAVIGRTKRDSDEIADAPGTAHISRVQLTVDGTELELYRRSVPFGTLGEAGLYFVAFSASPIRFQLLLSRMFGTSGDGVRDRLTDFSHPTSGATYFAPSRNALEAIASQA